MTGARLRLSAPVVLSAVSAVVFVALQVPVGDLWAARARQSAAANGAPLDYWFSWFGGATPPAAYSVISPYLSVLVGAAVLGAVATVASTALCAVAARDTPHPVAATWAAAVVTGFDLWSGRIAFSVGTAFAVGVVLAIRANRWLAAALAALLAGLSSPVVAVFLLVALAAAFATLPGRRIAIGAAAAAAAAVLAGTALWFGSPGVEPLVLADLQLLTVALVAMLIARPARWVTLTVVLSLVVYVVLAAVPNALGSNFHRMVWIWLPVAVIATARRTAALALACTAIAVWAGVSNTVHDLRLAFSPAAAPQQYAPLLNALDRLAPVQAYRVETVPDGTHDAAYFLLGHAMLARGYETQTDRRLNAVLYAATLDAATYRHWLDDNAVGFVVLHTSAPSTSAEYRLVATRPRYLSVVWSDRNWTVYRVAHAVPIVAPPGRMVEADQARLVVALARPARVVVRVRWSSALEVDGPPGAVTRLVPLAHGWSQLTADRPGRYVLAA